MASYGGALRIAWLAPAIGFLLGYAPAVAGHLLADGPGAPMARMDFVKLRSAWPPFVRTVLPIVFGFKSPTTERLAVPAWPALIVVAVIAFSYFKLGDRTSKLRRTFHVFLITTPIVFVISGAYIDEQSYRYLMPLHAALPVVYAVGIDGALRSNRIAGIALLTSLLALFVLQQASWYRRLEPDRDAQAIVSCLERSGVRAAYADYWLSYKLTFLTGERVIVAPTNGADRYPPYTAIVRAQPSAPTIARLPSGAWLPAGNSGVAAIHRSYKSVSVNGAALSAALPTRVAAENIGPPAGFTGANAIIPTGLAISS